MSDGAAVWRRGGVVGALVLALLGAAMWSGAGARPPLPADGDGAGGGWMPGFAIEVDGRTIAQPQSVVAAEVLRSTSVDADLELRRIGVEQWQLDVHAKRSIRGVWFPWRTRASALDTASTGTVLLFPMLLGVAAQAPSARSLGFDRHLYPGACFAPLLVLSDARNAEIVAAVNWPPRTVLPVFASEGLGLRYPEEIPAGATRSYRALVARRHGDETAGRAPWLLATLAYREWLLPNLEQAGLRVVQQPPWLAESEGWQNVQLQNLGTFDPDALEQRWRRWQGLLPWMQLWGQMSDYAGRPSSLATTIAAAEEVGCCIDRTVVHGRYGARLPEVVARIAAEGRVGLYARPRSPYRRLDGSGAADPERGFVLDWLAHNRDDLGANAFYVDVLGHRWFGEPLALARFVRDELPPGTVIEYAVDVYPRPALVSGSLGGGSFGGGPGREPRELGQLDAGRTTFPRFGRALLAEATLFLGESNGDHVFWGADSGHWAERQAFLLGAKLDAMRVAAAPDRPDEPNEALRRIVTLRRATGWWKREPVYLDRLGITGVPDGVDVRRFRGNAGEDIVVADNWGRRSGLSVRLDDRPIALPAEQLSIRVVESGA